jgi:hypothetical protein
VAIGNATFSAVIDARRTMAPWNSAELPTDRGSVRGLSPNEIAARDLGI